MCRCWLCGSVSHHEAEFSIGDRKPRKPLIRHVSQIDIKAMDKLVKQLQHDRLVDKICNRIPKTWSDKQ